MSQAGQAGRWRRAATVCAAAGMALWCGTALASERPRAPAPSSTALAPLYACRSQSDPASRLACYDAAVGALAQAQDQGTVQVFDREQIRQTRRSLFGFDLPRLAIFSGGDKQGGTEELSHVEGVIASATRDQDGAWVIVLEDGARWHQSDDATVGRWPRKGMAVAIDRGALGSYKMSIAKQPSIKVRREG